jgi:hypothetical protein
MDAQLTLTGWPGGTVGHRRASARGASVPSAKASLDVPQHVDLTS